jgi:hypothetical protein
LYISQYAGGEPCGTCGHVMSAPEKKLHDHVMPTCIIPGFLYMGSYDTASRPELMKAMNITHMLNVCNRMLSPHTFMKTHLTPSLLHIQTVLSCPALFKNTFTYHTVSTNPPDLGECFKFLGEFVLLLLARFDHKGPILTLDTMVLTSDLCMALQRTLTSQGTRSLCTV